MHWDALKWAYESKLPETIKGSAHAVLTAIAYSMHPETKKCNPSLERLCRLTRLKSGAVKTALKILKQENLISISSGKRKRISNDYVINFTVIPKSAKAKSLTTKINAASSDDSSSPTQTPAESSSRVTNSFDKGIAPFSAENARDVTMDFFSGLDWYRTGGERIWSKWDHSIKIITEFIAFLPDPTVKDVEKVFKQIRTDRHWEALEYTIDTLREKYEVDSKIRNWRSYSLTVLKNNLDG